jgi:hypothetical protein
MSDVTKEHSDFANQGHNLASSNWSAWWCAYQYAASVKSDLLPLIDKGCDYAEKQKHVPQKYLAAAETLYWQAIDRLAKARGES